MRKLYGSGVGQELNVDILILMGREKLSPISNGVHVFTFFETISVAES